VLRILHRAFVLTLRTSLSTSRLRLLLPAKSPTACLILPLALSMILPIVYLLWQMIRRSHYFPEP